MASWLLVFVVALFVTRLTQKHNSEYGPTCKIKDRMKEVKPGVEREVRKPEPIHSTSHQNDRVSDRHLDPVTSTTTPLPPSLTSSIQPKCITISRRGYIKGKSRRPALLWLSGPLDRLRHPLRMPFFYFSIVLLVILSLLKIPHRIRAITAIHSFPPIRYQSVEHYIQISHPQVR